jgi:ADP-L-glycero-D-manno-heptose 6-epimerase
MIVVTGAGGFIGSNLVEYLNDQGHSQIIAVDDFDQSQKNEILEHKDVSIYVNRSIFINFLKTNTKIIDIVYHLGARTDTIEPNKEIFNKLNLEYSKDIYNLCAEFDIPLIYASSAATYGRGEFGYDDDEDSIPNLKPLNAYGESKQEFDLWLLEEQKTKRPPFVIGLKFFNVYGYGEYNKGRMASVVFHALNQITETNKMNLFKSHNPEYKDGEQMRDFIYVEDVVRICYEFMGKGYGNSGIYNVGTGKARTFLDLAKGVFKALEMKENIEFIDTPKDLRNNYQYFTQATTNKLEEIGIGVHFTDLEDGIMEYFDRIQFQDYLLM